MAATSAGHIQPQKQHQPTQQQQQKMSSSCNMNRSSPQQQQQQPQLHNMQQQQQYALKQQQHNYNMQQQQQMHHQIMQQQHLKMQQQQQQHQQMYQNSQDSALTHMKPCQNYMTPMPQTHNKFAANLYTNNTSHYQQQFTNHHRAMPSTHHQQQHVANLPTGLVSGNGNNNTTRSTAVTCIPPNVVAPSSANQNMYPNQNHNNNCNMKQQHNYNNNNNVLMTPPEHQEYFNQQEQNHQIKQNQKQQQQLQSNSQININTNNSRLQLNAKQYVANNNNNNNDNSSCNANCNTTNLNGNFIETNGSQTNGLHISNNNNNNNNHIDNHHSMSSGVKANIPPGWRRLTNNNNEIVYISPTGSTLRSPFQIKDYLLSPGTCKCGLPCPLQPEYFFDFNVQVPNTPLTMPTYQSNEFNASTFYSSLTSAAAAASASADSQTSCSTQQSALMTSTESSNAFVDTTSSSSSSSSLFSSFYSSASIPSATSPSSLTCLHLKRFLDCQQLHANPTESLTKDAKRRKTAYSESTFFTTASSPALSPAATTQTSTATISSDTKSIFATDSGSGICGLQHETSHNSSFKMLPPNLKQVSSQQQQQQHEQHLSNQHEMRQQYMPTNPTYNNNGMMGSTNKIWPKDERILPTATVVQQHESHATPSTQHIRTIGENEDKHTQWSPNLCNKPQDICQTKHQQQQQRTMPSIDTNTKEEFQRQIDDLNGYLQRQTTIVHNSLMNFETNTQNEHTLSEKVALEDEVEDDEEEEEGEEDEEDEEEAEGDGEELEEEQENEDDEEVENKHLKDVDVVRTSNSLADCTTYQEINTKNDNQESNIEEEANEEVDNNNDDNADNEDPTDALDDEHVENDCESNIVSGKQSIFDKNSSLNSTNSANFYQMSLSQNQNIKQQPLFTNIQNILSPGQTTLPNKLSFTAAGIKNPIQNLFRQHAAQQQHSVRGSIKLVSTAQESPVSSSTVVGSRSTPDLQRKTPDNIKKPEQVGAISTSNESPKPCPPSQAGSVESTSSKASNSKPALSPLTSPITMLHLKTNQQPGSILQKPPPQQVRILRHIKNAGHIQQPQRLAATNTSRATVTTIAGNRGAATTTTTTSASAQRIIPSAPSPAPSLKLSTPMQKLTTNSTTTSIPISQLQLQPLLRSNDNTGNSQIIMTSTGQLIVMPSTNNKPHIQQQQQQQQQVIIASGNATTTTQSQATTNVIIQQQDVLNNAQQLTTATLQQQSNGSYIVSQPANSQSTTAQLQPATVILNSGQNLITNNGTKVLTNTGNIIHAASAQPILTTTNQLLSTPTNTSQQTVVLNALPNGGYVIQQQQPQTAQATAQTQQQQFATLDGQVIQHLVQQPDGRIIITSSGDPKRKPKKRKTSPSPATNNGTAISTQISPTMPSQTATLLQQHVANLQASTQPAQTATQPQVVQLTTAPAANAATTATYPQQFQLGNGIQGIVVNKPAANTTTTQPQQILLQNGQIIQPMNLIGQQLILPTGLVMTPDTTLLQIQNVGSCGPTTNILTTTPQGAMMLRATSPQTNKQFIQSATTGQQFIVGSNGQLSPIGQIYSTPMGLVMPASTQHNPTATATFVQQNATAIQVQPSHHQQVSTAPQHITLQALQQHPQSLTQQQQHVVQNQVGIVLETAATSTTSPNNHLISTRSAAASPPDTTTHSPRSPERPPSHRSGGSDMVQCVSSSEPDGGTISPLSSDSRQSPSTTVCDKGNVMSTAYQNANIYKPTEAKTRRVQTPPQYQVIGTGGGNNGGSGTTTITNASQMTGLTNLTLQQHNPQQHQQHSADNNNGGNNKSETHDSPQYSPNTTLMITPPPPSRTPTPQQQGLQNANTVNIEYQPSQQQQLQLRTPTKNGNGRNRNRVFKNMARDVKSLNAVDTIEVQASSSSSPPLAANLQRSFAVGELIWGPSRGFPAWPGKIVKVLDNQSESVWVQWFGGGGRSNTEIMAIHLLQSLSEGLEAHHKAQKDTRKSRKLNSQLEKAIQEAMTELDRISASSTTPTTAMTANKQVQQPTSSTQHQGSPANRANKRPIPRTGGYELIAGLANSNTSSNVISTTTGLAQSRHKPIRIAPAPPPTAGASNSPTKSSTTASSTGNQIANSSSSAASLSSSSLAK